MKRKINYLGIMLLIISTFIALSVFLAVKFDFKKIITQKKYISAIPNTCIEVQIDNKY